MAHDWGASVESNTEGVVEDCSTKCVVVGVVTLVGPAKFVKAARGLGLAEKLFARETGLLNRNPVFRIGYGWKGTAREGRVVFRAVLGHPKAKVRILGRVIKIHWHLP